jgi:hypothetical protein
MYMFGLMLLNIRYSIYTLSHCQMEEEERGGAFPRNTKGISRGEKRNAEEAASSVSGLYFILLCYHLMDYKEEQDSREMKQLVVEFQIQSKWFY